MYKGEMDARKCMKERGRQWEIKVEENPIKVLPAAPSNSQALRHVETSDDCLVLPSALFLFKFKCFLTFYRKGHWCINADYLWEGKRGDQLTIWMTSLVVTSVTIDRYCLFRRLTVENHNICRWNRIMLSVPFICRIDNRLTIALQLPYNLSKNMVGLYL